MKRGKVVCEILKSVRSRVAMLNDIKYEPSECFYEGNCHGCCPKCDAELEQLVKQLEIKHSSGGEIVYGENDNVFIDQLWRMASECPDDDGDVIDTLDGIMPLMGDICSDVDV